MAHNCGVERGAKPPHRFVDDYGSGIAQIGAQKGAARTQDESGAQLEAPIAQCIDRHNDEFQNAGGEGSNCGAVYP